MYSKPFFQTILLPPKIKWSISFRQLQDSLEEVECLLRKHNDFEKSLEVQEEKVTALKKTADCLTEANPRDIEK